MYLVPSNNITATPKRVGTTRYVLYNTSTVTYGAGGAATFHPYAMYYFDSGADSMFHIYKLRVDNIDTQPVSVQVSNLSVSSTDLICHDLFAQTDLTDPDTVFALLNLAGTNGICDDADDNYVVINGNDDFSTAPQIVHPVHYYFSPLYDAVHHLQGIVQNDPLNHKVVLYQGKDFNNPTTLVTNTNYYLSMMWFMPFSADDFPPPGYDFLVTNNADNTQSLWRIASDGSAVKTYDSLTPVHSGTSYLLRVSAENSDSVFAVDEPANYSVGTVNLLQQPRVGGPPVILYSFPLPQAQVGSVSAQAYIRNLQIIGSRLFYLVDKLGVGDSSLESVPVGQTSTSSVMLKQYPEQIASCNYHYPAGDDTQGWFTVNLDSHDITQLTPVHALSSEVFKPDGTTIISRTPNSASYVSFNGNVPVLFQVRDITATDGSHGGGTLNLVDITTGAATPFHLGNGDVFKVPAGNIISAGLNRSGIAMASLYDVSVDGSDRIVLLDLTTHLAVPF